MRIKNSLELSLSAYANHRRSKGLVGGTREAIKRAAADGRIKISSSKTINPIEADKSWPDIANPKKLRTSPATSSKYAGIKMQHEKIKCALAKLEYETRIGKLISAHEVEQEAFSTARNLRDRLNTIPDRICPELANENDVFKIETILRREIALALEGFIKDSKL